MCDVLFFSKCPSRLYSQGNIIFLKSLPFSLPAIAITWHLESPMSWYMLMKHCDGGMLPLWAISEVSAGECEGCLKHGEGARKAATSSAVVALDTTFLPGNTFVCVCVCANMLTCGCAPCAHMCNSLCQRLTLGVFHCSFLSFVAHWLASQLANELWWSTYLYTPISRVTDLHDHIHCHVGVRIQTQVIFTSMACTYFSLNHLPSLRN